MEPDNIMRRVLETLTRIPGSLLKSVPRNQQADDSELQKTIDALRERNPVDASCDHINSKGFPTPSLIAIALKEIGGGQDSWEGFAYLSQVCRVVGLRDNVGDWKNAPEHAAEAYERIRQALLQTTDRDQILDLLRADLPPVADPAE